MSTPPPPMPLPPNTEYNPYVPPQPALARTKSNPAFFIVALSFLALHLLTLIPILLSNTAGNLLIHAVFGTLQGFGVSFSGIIVLLYGVKKYGPGQRSKPLLTQLGAFVGLLIVLISVGEFIGYAAMLAAETINSYPPGTFN